MSEKFELKGASFCNKIELILKKKAKEHSLPTAQLHIIATCLSLILNSNKYVPSRTPELFDTFIEQLLEHIGPSTWSFSFLYNFFTNLSDLKALYDPDKHHGGLTDEIKIEHEKHQVRIMNQLRNLKIRTKNLHLLYSDFPEFNASKSFDKKKTTKSPFADFYLDRLNHQSQVHKFCENMTKQCEEFLKFWEQPRKKGKRGARPRDELGIYLTEFVKLLQPLIRDKKKTIDPLDKKFDDFRNHSIFSQKRSGHMKYRVSALRLIVNGCYLLGPDVSYYEETLAKRISRARTLPIDKHSTLPAKLTLTPKGS